MDYLLFCTSECDDALRDRDLFLVQNATDEDHARALLAAHFLADGSSDDAAYYSVMVKGDNLVDGFAGQTHYCYRMQVVAAKEKPQKRDVSTIDLFVQLRAAARDDLNKAITACESLGIRVASMTIEDCGYVVHETDGTTRTI
jgi:hypothetical protein